MVCLSKKQTVLLIVFFFLGWFPLKAENMPEAVPGGVVTLCFIIDGDPAENKAFRGRFKLPAGWKLIYGDENEINITQGKKRPIFIAAKVPNYAPEGKYEITYEYKAFNETIGAPFQIIRKHVRVRAIKQLEIELIKQLEYIPGGEENHLKFVYSNKGNIPLYLKFEVTCDPSCEFYLSQEAVCLQPDTTKQGSIVIFPSSNNFESWTQLFFLNVRDQETDELIAKKTFILEVLPRGRPYFDSYERVPAYLRFIAVGDNRNTVLAEELSGGGVLEGGQEIGFSIKVPTDFRNTIYDQYQRFYGYYSDSNKEIILGDTQYILTPLTERGWHGRGGAIHLHQGSFNLGAFYTQNIFRTYYKLKESGAYLGYTTDRNVNLSCNFLHKNLDKDPSSSILSLQALHKAEDQSSLVLEIARNLSGGKANRKKSAIYAEFQVNLAEKGWYHYEKIYAGRKFFGYYNHFDFQGGAFNYALTPKTIVQFSLSDLRQNSHNPAISQETIFSPRQKECTGQLTYRYNRHLCSSINGLWLQAKDLSNPFDYNFCQKWIGFNLSFTNAHLNLVGISSFGEQKDFTTGRSVNNLQQYALYANFSLFSHMNLNLVYQCGHTNFYDAIPWRSMWGGSLRFSFDCQSFIEFFLQFTKNTPTFSNQYQAGFKFRHLFNNGHLVDMSFDKMDCTNFPNPTTYLFLFSYALPLNLPVRKNRSVGSIEGQLLSDESPLANAIVCLNGQKMWTDNQGSFKYSNLRPGSYQLWADHLPAENKILEPMYINVEGGKSTAVQANAINPSTLSGRVLIYKYLPPKHLHDQLQLQEVGGKEGITVMIEQDDKFYTCLTDPLGNFHFADLPSGKWRIYLEENALPTSAKYETNDIEVEIANGEHKVMLFKIIPSKRKFISSH